MLGIRELFYMNKSDIKNSSYLFLYKAIIDLNSGRYLLDAFNADRVYRYIKVIGDFYRTKEYSMTRNTLNLLLNILSHQITYRERRV